MKTFQEALDVVMPAERVSAPAERHRQIVMELVERTQRAMPLLQEAGDHEHLEKVLIAMVDTSCCARHAMQNAFNLGRQIGMEMERSETGGVAIE